jgi:prepilin-type N-terminal cleavage/methylation domain-containing protein
MKSKNNNNGFTLIELLVVISILGILMGIVGPKVIDLLSGSEKTKVQTIVRGWVTQLHQYKSHYGYFPPFLLTGEEGIAVELGDEGNLKNFLISLKGKALNDDGTWEPIESGNEQNRKAKEFHSFSSDEFDSEGKLIGANNIGILVDQNGDGLIELDPSLSNDILQSLTIDYSASEIQAVDVEKFGRIREKVAIFLLQDDDLDVQNVYSWNVEKFFE